MPNLSNITCNNSLEKQTFIIDTHVHPFVVKEFFEKKYKKEFDVSQLVNSWFKKDISDIVCIATDIGCIDTYSSFCNNNCHCYYTVGIHPCDITKLWESEIKKIEYALQNNTNKKIVAIGEVGIDLYRNDVPYELQEKVFRSFIDLAIAYRYPMVIHSRNAIEKVYACLTAASTIPIGVVHAYQENALWAQKFIDLGWYIGIGGMITYPKNDMLRAVLCKEARNHFVLETDGPFLPPQWMRGEINTSETLGGISAFIANVLGEEEGEIRKRAYQNTLRLFPHIVPHGLP